VVYAKTIIHLSVGESDGYLPPLHWIIVNYFIPCHRTYSGQHNQRGAWWEDWTQYCRIYNGFPIFWLALFSMAWYKYRYIFYFQVRMLSSSLLRALLFLLVTSHVSAKKNKTSSSNQDVKNQTAYKRQYIGKWLLTAAPWAQLYCLDVLLSVLNVFSHVFKRQQRKKLHDLINKISLVFKVVIYKTNKKWNSKQKHLWSHYCKCGL